MSRGIRAFVGALVGAVAVIAVVVPGGPPASAAGAPCTYTFRAADGGAVGPGQVRSFPVSG